VHNVHILSRAPLEALGSLAGKANAKGRAGDLVQVGHCERKRM
jgi:hypothetical protein